MKRGIRIAGYVLFVVALFAAAVWLRVHADRWYYRTFIVEKSP